MSYAQRLGKCVLDKGEDHILCSFIKGRENNVGGKKSEKERKKERKKKTDKHIIKDKIENNNGTERELAMKNVIKVVKK
jgi:hypothetical protein